VRQTSCISTSSTFVGLIFICLNSIFQCQLAQNYHFGLLYPCAKKTLVYRYCRRGPYLVAIHPLRGYL
jgi:hypothetical protein